MSVTPVTVVSHRQQAMSHGAAMARIALPVRGLSNPNPLSFHAFSRSAFLNRSSLRHATTPAAPLLARRLCAVAHLDQIPGVDMVHAHLDVAQHLVGNLKGSVMMLADAAAVSVDGAVDKAVEATEVVKQGSDGWLGGLTDTLERILIFLKDGLSMLHVPYAYGFAIILLTLLVKAATYPLTKSQVESTIAMQNLQPKLKAIQARYQGDQERIQLETARLYKTAGVNPLAGCLPTLATLPVWIGLYRALSNVANEGLLTEGFFWIPSLAGPTTIAARSGGSGVAWLYPFTDGAPPLGWSDTTAYLVLPVLLVLSQFVSMQIMQPPQTDPSQKNTQIILKFLPLMIGYFSLSVPSGLSLYWLTNNILSTSQQVWLRRSQPAAAGAASDTTIITAGQAKRSVPTTLIPPADSSVSSPKQTRSFKEDRRGEKFRELKQKEAQRKMKREAEAKAETPPPPQISRNGSAELDDSEEDSIIIDVSNESGEGVGVDTNGSGPGLASGPKRGKRSKRTRAE